MSFTRRLSASVGLALVAALALSEAAFAADRVPAHAGATTPTLLLGLVLMVAGAALILDSRRRRAREGSPVRLPRQR